MRIDKLTAGTKLDKLIAEKVMGWKESDLIDGWIRDPEGYGASMMSVEVRRGEITRDFHPSTRIEDAWKVAEKLLSMNYDLEGVHNMRRLEHRKWVCEFGMGTNYKHQEMVKIGKNTYTSWRAYATADTAPLAICRAAMKVVTKQGI